MRKFLMKNDPMNDVRNASIGSAATFGAKVARMLLVALVAVSPIMWGCSFLHDEPVLLDSGSRKGIGFAMVSDTTALLAVGYYDHYEYRSGADYEECTKKGIRLVGTKGIEYNYWEGHFDCSGGYYSPPVIHPLGDSTVLFLLSNHNNEFVYYVWKVGQDPIEKKAVWNKYVEIFSGNEIFRQWKNGTFLFKYYDKFALLDTAANTITQVTKEEAGWPDGVEDAQYFGDDLMTIVLQPNNFSYSLVRNGEDTLSTYYEEAPNSYDVVRERFNGRYIIRMKTDAWYIFSTDSSWQISEKPVAKYYVTYFKPLDRE